MFVFWKKFCELPIYMASHKAKSSMVAVRSALSLPDV